MKHNPIFFCKNSDVPYLIPLTTLNTNNFNYFNNTLHPILHIPFRA